MFSQTCWVTPVLLFQAGSGESSSCPATSTELLINVHLSIHPLNPQGRSGEQEGTRTRWSPAASSPLRHTPRHQRWGMSFTAMALKIFLPV